MSELINQAPEASTAARAAELFEDHQRRIHANTDRLFLWLMPLQWLFGIAAALWISPRTWIGNTSYVHAHVWAAVFLGGIISSLPVYLILRHPGTVMTRHVVAVAQMLWSALLIHLTGGRIETHFHVFGSLAILAMYRDWRVLMTATVIVAGDHFARGIWWPQSVFGVFVTSPFRWVEHAIWVIYEDVFLWISCTRSIHEMRQIADRQALLESTNAQVQERTRLLEAESIEHRRTALQLRSANERAETANRAKSEFLARMSHEIRTPLNGVVGMIDLLQATEMKEKQRRYSHLARNSADALLAVINDILDFSKIEAGKVEIEAITFDLRELVENVTEVLGPVAGKKSLSLTCVMAENIPPRMVGDSNRIRQVVTNLINNAIKFTSKGSVRVAARVERQDEDNVYIRMRVEDTGIGIPADRLDRLFKSFSQVDSSTTRQFGGTGLGLVICKQLVELMGGKIGIESQAGEGTTFWFTLRLGIAVGGAEEASDNTGEGLDEVRVHTAEPGHRGLKGLHLLVAEDNEMNQFVTEQTLQRVGCTCDIVGDGILAIEAIQRRHYDLVLMDCQMPRMDGLEATRRIREQEAAAPGGQRIGIIALTAEAVQGDREKCLKAGMDGYVSKPINAEDLFLAIGHLVRSSGGRSGGGRMGGGAARAPVDGKAMLAKCGGDQKSAAAVRERFRSQADGEISKIELALVQGDAETLCRAAHILKTMTADMAAEGACSLARQIEELGQAEQLAEVSALVAALRADVGEINEWINQNLTSGAVVGA